MYSNLDLEKRILSIGKEIFRSADNQKGVPAFKNFWISFGMKFLIRHPKLKVQALKFVDVLPCLETGRRISGHFRLYILSGQNELPWLLVGF